MPEPTQSSPSSAEFRLDVDLANQAVAKLVDVRDQFVGIRARAADLGRSALVAPSAHDLISMEAFQLLARKADSGPGSLAHALDEGIRHIEGLIESMRADIRETEEAEASATRDLTA